MIALKEAECCAPGGPGLSSTTLAPAGESPAAKRNPFYESERELRDTHMNRRWISQVIVASSLASSPLLSQALTSNASLVTTPQPRAVIAGLAGNWRFDLYQLGHTSPVASGQREMRLLRDSTKLVWTESFDTKSDTGTGILGYDSAKRVYYVLGAYTHEPHPTVLIGRADESGRTILFDPAAGNLETPGVLIASEFRLVDIAHFEWVASDGRWRVVFTRIGGS